MTILKSIDSTIQSVVDTAAFAVMRRFGCGKGPIRFGMYLSVVATRLFQAATTHQPLYVVTAFMWLLIAEWHRRQDLSTGSRGLRSVNDIGFQWLKLFWAAFITFDVAIGTALDVSVDITLLTVEYFRATPPTPPPSRETSRQLATVGAV